MYKRIAKTKLGNVEFSSHGKGQPILVLHGGHSNCDEQLALIGIDLSKYRVIIPSRPGYGKTPLSLFKEPHTASDLLIDFLDALNIRKVVVYGISLGGLTAISLTANHPSRVEKLILVSAVSKKWLAEKGKIYRHSSKIFNHKIEWFTWWIVRILSRMNPEYLAKKFYFQFSTQSIHPLRKIDIDLLMTSLKHYRSKSGFVNDLKQDTNINDLLKIISPVLIIHSINDNSVSFEHATFANNMIKNSVLIKLENEWGHMIWLGSDSIKATNSIMDFLTGLEIIDSESSI